MSGITGKSVHAPGSLRFEVSYGSFVVRIAPEGPVEFDLPLPVPGTLTLPSGGIVEAGISRMPVTVSGPDEAAFDAGLIKGGLRVRNRRPGDIFHPAGMSGRKKVKELLIDLKVPRHGRETVPVLTCGEEIVWVMGIRADRRFLAGPDSKDTLIIYYSKPESEA